jgi:glycosyltransferase involved in cell wall biosynthesis
MHVALVSTFYYPRLRGGAEHTLHHHAEALAKRGLKVSTFSFHEGDQPERFRHNGVDCHALPVPNVSRCLNAKQRASAGARMLWHLLDVYNPVGGRLLERELRRVRPDLVHTETLPGWSCAAWTTIRRLGLPHVQMLHDYQFTCPMATRFRHNCNCQTTCSPCRPFALFRRVFSRQVSHVIANSHYTRKLHRELGFFRAAKIFDVIYGPVAARASRPDSQSPTGTLRVGYLGRLHPTKGLDLLIDEFLESKRPDAVLRIAGAGTEAYDAELRAKCAGKPVELLGHTPAADFLPTIDVLVVPSLWNEPMGRVVIEAASHGVPVIAAARGGIPELVRTGTTGWLFDPSSPGELSGLLARVTPAGLRALRPHCLDWAKNFAPEKIIERWLSLYDGLVAPNATTMATSMSRPVHAAAAC